MPRRFHRLPRTGTFLTLCATAALVVVSASAASAHDRYDDRYHDRSGSPFGNAFQRELGRIAAREVASVGHAIVDEIVYPHYHGNTACYDFHDTYYPVVSYTFVEPYYAVPPYHHAYRRAYRRARRQARREARHHRAEYRAMRVAADVRPSRHSQYMTVRENPQLRYRSQRGRRHRARDRSQRRAARRAAASAAPRRDSSAASRRD